MPRPLLGIYAFFRLPIPFPDRLSMIRDAEFDAISSWWDNAEGERRRLRDALPEMTRKAGLIFDNIHVPYRGCNALWSANDEERMDIVNRHIRWIEDCGRHSIPRMVMHVTLGTRATLHHEKGIDSVRRLVEAAERHGVTLAIENTRSPQHIQTILEAISSPFLGLCYDSSHDFLYSPTPISLLETWSSRLQALHLSDTDGKLDRHWLPGEGTVDFESLGPHLAKVEDNVPRMLEVVARDVEEAGETFLARAMERLVKHCIYAPD